MTGQDPLLWPTIKLVCDRLKEEGELSLLMCCFEQLQSTHLKTCAAQALADINRLEKTMRARLEWSDEKMLITLLVFLDTHTVGALHLAVNTETRMRKRMIMPR